MPHASCLHVSMPQLDSHFHLPGSIRVASTQQPSVLVYVTPIRIPASITKPPIQTGSLTWEQEERTRPQRGEQFAQRTISMKQSQLAIYTENSTVIQYPQVRIPGRSLMTRSGRSKATSSLISKLTPAQNEAMQTEINSTYHFVWQRSKQE